MSERDRPLSLGRALARGTAAPLRFARNVLKYGLLCDVSIRSERFGREHMIDLAARYIRSSEVRGSRAISEWCRASPGIALTEYARFTTTGLAFVVHRASGAT